MNCFASHFWYIFFNRNDSAIVASGPVNTYPDIFENGEFCPWFLKKYASIVAYSKRFPPLTPPHENASIPHRAYVM